MNPQDEKVSKGILLEGQQVCEGETRRNTARGAEKDGKGFVVSSLQITTKKCTHTFVRLARH